MESKIISLIQQKGGTGKSTLAANLAVYYAEKNKKVTLIDTDPMCQLSYWFNKREDIINPKIDFMAISGWRIFTAIDDLKNRNDIIIIDTPSHSEPEAVTCTKAADLVLIPTQTSALDLWITNETVKLTLKERIPHRIILNRVNNQSKFTESMKGKLSNCLTTKIANRSAYAESLYYGKTILEYNSAQAKKEISRLAEEVGSLLLPKQFNSNLEDLDLDLAV